MICSLKTQKSSEDVTSFILLKEITYCWRYRSGCACALCTQKSALDPLMLAAYFHGNVPLSECLYSVVKGPLYILSWCNFHCNVPWSLRLFSVAEVCFGSIWVASSTVMFYFQWTWKSHCMSRQILLSRISIMEYVIRVSFLSSTSRGVWADPDE